MNDLHTWVGRGVYGVTGPENRQGSLLLQVVTWQLHSPHQMFWRNDRRTGRQDMASLHRGLPLGGPPGTWDLGPLDLNPTWKDKPSAIMYVDPSHYLGGGDVQSLFR